MFNPSLRKNHFARESLECLFLILIKEFWKSFGGTYWYGPFCKKSNVQNFVWFHCAPPPSSFQWNLKMAIINSPNTLRLSFNFLGACREILFVSSCIEFCCWMWWREIKKNKKKVVEVPKAPEMNHRTHYFLKKKEWVGPAPTKIMHKTRPAAFMLHPGSWFFEGWKQTRTLQEVFRSTTTSGMP